MKKYWDSLRTFEKRVVFYGGAVVFVVLNLVFVRPYFSDWSATQDEKWQAEKKRDIYQAEIDKVPTYKREIARLEGAGGAPVPTEEQNMHFQTAIQSQAGQSRVSITSNSKITYHTNQFFLDLSQSINMQAWETNLVDFLYQLGSGSSMIRVRDLSIRPDPPRQQLVAGIKLVASYQKKSPAKAAAPQTPSAKPFTSTAK